MQQSIISSFSIASVRLGADYLTKNFPWRGTETMPHEKLDYHVTMFDLGIGEHERVDDHVRAAKAELLVHEAELDVLHHDCSWAIWLHRPFIEREATIDVSPSMSGALALMRVALMIRLKAPAAE